jgi:hypothetical protein
MKKASSNKFTEAQLRTLQKLAQKSIFPMRLNSVYGAMRCEENFTSL